MSFTQLSFRWRVHRHFEAGMPIQRNRGFLEAIRSQQGVLGESLLEETVSGGLCRVIV